MVQLAKLRTHQTGRATLPMHTCFVHATAQPAIAMGQRNRSGPCHMGEQSQLSGSGASKCTDPYVPGGWFGAAWQSLAVVLGEPGTVVRWTTYTELALAGMAVPRSAQEESSPAPAREAKQKGTTSQHRQPLSFHNWAHLNSLYLSQSSRAIGPRKERSF